MSTDPRYERIPCPKRRRRISKNNMPRHERSDCGAKSSTKGRRKAWRRMPMAERRPILERKAALLREYRATPHGREMATVCRDIHRLRTAIDRFMVRIERYEKRLIELTARREELRRTRVQAEVRA